MYTKYKKTKWVDGETPIDAENLNKIENALEDLSMSQTMSPADVVVKPHAYLKANPINNVINEETGEKEMRVELESLIKVIPEVYKTIEIHVDDDNSGDSEISTNSEDPEVLGSVDYRDTQTYDSDVLGTIENPRPSTTTSSTSTCSVCGCGKPVITKEVLDIPEVPGVPDEDVLFLIQGKDRTKEILDEDGNVTNEDELPVILKNVVIKGNISDLDTEKIKARVTKNEEDIEELKEADEVITEKIKTLEKKIEDQKKLIDKLTTDLKNLENRFNSHIINIRTNGK